MKRDGFIIEEIVEYSNIAESFDYVMRGNKRKHSRAGRYLLHNREEVIKRLQEEIVSGEYRVSGYNEYTICERGKERVIQSIPLIDRIALNAIMRVVEKHLTRRFIADTAASIKGRGGHYLHNRMLRGMKKDPEGTRAVYKSDFRKYYQSIDQDIMMFVVKRFFKDRKLINILDGCVRMLPEGLSIGLRVSQALGNLLLNYYLDHKLKDKMGVRYMRRYCDDVVVQASDYRALTPIVHAIHLCAEEAKLQIKGNEQVFSLNYRDIDFLGYRVAGDGKITIRKHIKQRFARRWKRVKSKKRRQELAASFCGIAKHAHARHLFKTITGIKMKEYSELGITYTRKDGKKSFDCKKISIDTLINTHVSVEDFETDVTTSQGPGRFLVKVKDESGVDGKYFTNDDEMKFALLEARKSNEIPFGTFIRRVPLGGGKYRYKFT